MARTVRHYDSDERRIILLRERKKQSDRERKKGDGMWFERLQREIVWRERMQIDTSKNLGMVREEIVSSACEEIQKEFQAQKRFFEFIRSERYGFADVIDGVDFYIIVLKQGVRKVFPINVTGPRWISDKQMKHPENCIISISLSYPCSKERFKMLVRETKQKILSFIA